MLEHKILLKCVVFSAVRTAQKKRKCSSTSLNCPNQFYETWNMKCLGVILVILFLRCFRNVCFHSISLFLFLCLCLCIFLCPLESNAFLYRPSSRIYILVWAWSWLIFSIIFLSWTQIKLFSFFYSTSSRT